MKLIAEISCSHNGSLERALETIRQVDADLIKFQTWESMAVPYVIKEGPWAGADLVELYQEARTPWEWHERLFREAEDLGMIPFSTPFDIPSVDFLEGLECPLYKVASFELVDLRLVEYVAMTGKPMVLSTGQSNRTEIRAAINTAKKYCNDITLLHCVSEYPTPLEHANLRTMRALKRHFPDCKIGISDHSEGPVIPLMAAALGASLIEKHVTLSRDGLDGGFAMLPDEFNYMAAMCRDAVHVLGEIKFAEGGELRRSLYFSQDLERGTVIDHRHIKTARPNLGLSPVKIEKVLGQKLSEDVKKDQPVSLSDVLPKLA